MDSSLPRSGLMEFNSEDEIQNLSLSIDFLVELSDGIFAKREVGSSFVTFCHQAVDFILASLKNILSSKREKDLVEEIINCLVAHLMKRMCTIPENAGTSDSGSVDFSDAQFSVQHLFRKLGNEEYIGQQIILAVSQKISNVSERLLLVDPFDDAFPDMHVNMFIMMISYRKMVWQAGVISYRKMVWQAGVLFSIERPGTNAHSKFCSICLDHLEMQEPRSN